jgi:hypothetical protein
LGLSILTVTATVPGLTGCGSHLNRSNAKAQLEALLKQEQKLSPFGRESLTSHVGTVSGTCIDLPLSSDPVEDDTDNAVLAAAGYLTVRPIKPHVWDVQLTNLGAQANSTEGKYGHQQNTDCDDWQVSLPLSRYDHLEVTGIVEDGVHAKVDANLTYVITALGLAVKKIASSVIFDVEKRKYTRLLGAASGETLAHQFFGS